MQVHRACLAEAWRRPVRTPSSLRAESVRIVPRRMHLLIRTAARVVRRLILNVLPLAESWQRPTGLHSGTGRLTATRAERPFFLVSFDSARVCCGRAAVA